MSEFASFFLFISCLILMRKWASLTLLFSLNGSPFWGWAQVREPASSATTGVAAIDHLDNYHLEVARIALAKYLKEEEEDHRVDGNVTCRKDKLASH